MSRRGTPTNTGIARTCHCKIGRSEAKEDCVKRLLMLFGIAAALALPWARGLAQGQTTQAAKKELLFVSSSQAKFTGLMPGVSQAVVWGDPDKGAYGSFTKFVPGYDAGMHTHTNDV